MAEAGVGCSSRGGRFGTIRTLTAPAKRALVGALVVFTLCSVVAPASALHFDRACPQHVTEDTGARRRYIHCEYERIRPPGAFRYVLGIGFCESGPALMDTYVDDPRTKEVVEGDEHGGPFQQQARYWLGRFRTYTGKKWPRDGELRNNPGAFRSNVIVSLRMARARGTWTQDWSCA